MRKKSKTTSIGSGTEIMPAFAFTAILMEHYSPKEFARRQGLSLSREGWKIKYAIEKDPTELHTRLNHMWGHNYRTVQVNMAQRGTNTVRSQEEGEKTR